MGGDQYRVSIKKLENGYEVEVPDMEAIAKKKADAKKAKQPEPYCGDCYKSYAAKNVKEVLSLVGTSLKMLPGSEYDVAFEEAASKSK